MRTLSILPDKFDAEMKSYAKVTMSAEIDQLDQMEIFQRYITKFLIRITAWISKNQDKKEEQLELMSQYQELLKVYNKYSDFYYGSVHLRRENIRLKHKNYQYELQIFEQNKEIESLKTELTKRQL